MLTYFKEQTESKQFFCYNSQVSETIPELQYHGLSPTCPELPQHISAYQLSNSSYVRIYEGMRGLELHILAMMTLQQQLRLPHRLLFYLRDSP